MRGPSSINDILSYAVIAFKAKGLLIAEMSFKASHFVCNVCYPFVFLAVWFCHVRFRSIRLGSFTLWQKPVRMRLVVEKELKS